ncbi:MAG: hypothetical protein JSW65_06635 [Candidatus Bipolaricaulota bacterium]|nr:MAG: hypothetical protein JSW65_06635 [Candidatus Bipolaricaulota bacterium]
MSFVTGLTYILAALFAIALGVLTILAGARALGDVAWSWLLDHAAGAALQIFIGACLVLVAAHFVKLLVTAQRAALDLSHDGLWGTIALSPKALKQFVRDILTHDVGIEEFRVSLRRAEDGLIIGVRTGLSSDDTVTEIGERIQRVVAERVSQRAGVHVQRVEIVVGSMRGSRAAEHAGGG